VVEGARVMRDGAVFEQGGVGFSEVWGSHLPPSLWRNAQRQLGKWIAMGTSMVLHPRNPYVPTVHLNYRYFEAGPVWWFARADLTPYYPLPRMQPIPLFTEASLTLTIQSITQCLSWCDEYFT